MRYDVRFNHVLLYKMAEYDLTSQIGGYLDRHLVFPMLEFLSEKRVRGSLVGQTPRVGVGRETGNVEYM